jgi:predicted GNAT superfamily acetyltransferase
MIHYREVHTPEDFEKLVDLQAVIWSMSDRFSVPHHMLHTTIYHGGNVIAADKDGELIGFAYMFPVRRDDGWLLWSHMTGVHPDHQGQRIGLRLKLEQRKWALAHGYETIGWTYDPLQSGNARFNMRYLGAFSHTYLVNFYGVMTDSINAGIPSDRLEIIWNLNDDRVRKIAEEDNSEPLVTVFPEANFLLHTLPEGMPHTNIPSQLTDAFYFAEIPRHLAELKENDIKKAIDWQKALRQALQCAFVQGYAAADFVTQDNRCWYVLQKR